MLKEKIIASVADELSKLGIKGCRMDDIASALSISKKTLYEQFGSKSNLLYECISFSIRTNKAQIALEAESAESPLAAIAHINDLILRQALNFGPTFHRDIKRRTEFAKLMEEEYIDYIHSCYLKHFERGVKQGIFRDNINMNHTLSFFDEQILNMYEKINADTIQKIDHYNFTIFTYLSGICTDKGRKELECLRPMYANVTH